jgi:tRNA-dihydrouridine synthase B
MKIGNIEFENNTVLAPMAGITNMPFRVLCRELNAGLVCTEMVSSKALSYDNQKSMDMLQISKLEHPVSLQLFGSEPEVLGEIVRKIDHLPIDIIDMNMGCPAPKITKNLEGSALLKDPKRVGQIVKAMSSATKKPVTIKIRKGFNSTNINAVEIAKIIEDNGAAAVTVHGRTREEFFGGKVDIDIIKKVKENVTIPVIGNGDILSPIDAKHMIDYTGCDGVMIGRGAQGNPWIFNRVSHYLKTGELLPEPTIDEIIAMALRHGRMLIEYKGEHVGTKEMRKHIAWYTKGAKSSAKIRLGINTANSYDELEDALNSLKELQ